MLKIAIEKVIYWQNQEVILIKYKEKYRPGMIFRSKKYPYADIMIDYVYYMRDLDSAYDFNQYSIIDWVRANRVEFDKFICKKKGYNYTPNESGEMDFTDKSTFPYPYWGEMKTKSMDAYINKYELEFVGMSDREVIVYTDDKGEYSAGFKKD